MLIIDPHHRNNDVRLNLFDFSSKSAIIPEIVMAGTPLLMTINFPF